MGHGQIARRRLGGAIGMGMVVADNPLLRAPRRAQQIELRLGVDGKCCVGVFSDIGRRYNVGDDDIGIALAHQQAAALVGIGRARHRAQRFSVLRRELHKCRRNRGHGLFYATRPCPDKCPRPRVRGNNKDFTCFMSVPSLKTLSVAPEQAGARLDKWLAEAVPGVSRSRIQALIGEGAVTVSGKVTDNPAQKVKAGQWVKLKLPAAVEASPAAQEMDLDVVYEDDDLIVINKPPGLVVHPAPGNFDKTLVNALLAHCGKSLAGIGGVRRPGIVHRIDKNTSGLLVAAKTDKAHAGLAAQFAAHTIERAYDAVVWGIPQPHADQIVGAIGRSRHNRQKMAVVRRGGKDAETGYQTLMTFGTLAAQVRCRLKTGRTHQIRVHMASIGHPLVGDTAYGSNRRRSMKGVPPDLADLLKSFPRQALHAKTLGFIHPVTEKALRFDSALPEDMMELIEALSALENLDEDFEEMDAF